MSKITKIKKYAILWLNSLGHQTKEIASELKVSDVDVAFVLSELNANAQLKDNNVKQLIQNKTMSKNTRNVAIMTKEASSLADEHIKNMSNDTPSRHEKNIFRPK